MMRLFNTVGPVHEPSHYYRSPLEHVDIELISRLIKQRYTLFVHAPPRTGKTSLLLALLAHLQGLGERCVYLDAAAENDLTAAVRRLLAEKPAGADAKPLTLLIDTLDVLADATLGALLRELGAARGPAPGAAAPAVVLCGRYDLRRLGRIDANSPYIRLNNFPQQAVAALFEQHYRETGQITSAEALERIWRWSSGQPWLVGALGFEACFRMAEGRDRAQPITCERVDAAAENLLGRLQAPLENLPAQLLTPAVQQVLEPLLLGAAAPQTPPPGAIDHLRDLGLIRALGPIHIAHPYYRELIPRALIHDTEASIAQEAAWYQRNDGRLEMDKVFVAVQHHFTKYAAPWLERFPYREAGPFLLLQAFLGRCIGGSRLERDYQLGWQRTEVLLHWPYQKGLQRVLIVLKRLETDLEHTLETSLEHCYHALARRAMVEGHLLIFGAANALSQDDKPLRRDEFIWGKLIRVWGVPIA